MDKHIEAFLNNQRVSVLGVLQNDRTIHSAALHFAYSKDPLAFYFITEKKSRKCASLLDNKAHNASLVIGFSEEEFTTFQCEGTVKIISDPSKLEASWNIYVGKFAERSSRKSHPDFVLLEFIPQWWRYTNSQTKISSED